MTNIKVKLINYNRTILIETAEDVVISNVLIDSWSNRANYESQDKGVHSYCIDTDTVTEVIDTVNHKRTYRIDSFNYNVDDWSGIYIVTCLMGTSPDYERQTYITFSEELFYCFRYNLMQQICIPCNDAKTFSRLETLFFREVMFRESVLLNHIPEAIGFYEEILRLVGDCDCLRLKQIAGCCCNQCAL